MEDWLSRPRQDPRPQRASEKWVYWFAQRCQQTAGAVAVLYRGRGHHDCQERAEGVQGDVLFMAFDTPARVVARACRGHGVDVVDGLGVDDRGAGRYQSACAEEDPIA